MGENKRTTTQHVSKVENTPKSDKNIGFRCSLQNLLLLVGFVLLILDNQYIGINEIVGTYLLILGAKLLALCTLLFRETTTEEDTITYIANKYTLIDSRLNLSFIWCIIATYIYLMCLNVASITKETVIVLIILGVLLICKKLIIQFGLNSDNIEKAKSYNSKL